MRSNKVGKDLKVVFWDHVQDNVECEVVKCIVWGNCIAESNKSITICCWELPELKEKGENREIFIILKSAIIDQYEVVQYKKLRKPRIKEIDEKEKKNVTKKAKRKKRNKGRK